MTLLTKNDFTNKIFYLWRLRKITFPVLNRNLIKKTPLTPDSQEMWIPKLTYL